MENRINRKTTKNQKPWVVFDIDGTLTMTIDPEEYEDLDSNLKEHFKPFYYKPFERRDIIREAWVMRRPYLDKLLKFSFDNFRIGIWSIGQPGYVKAMVDLIFDGYSPEFVYDFTHCVREYNPLRFYKPLSQSPAKEGHIVEDSPEVVDKKDNYILIQRFDLYDPSDPSDDTDHIDTDDDTNPDTDSSDCMVDPYILIHDDCLLSLIEQLEEIK